jgi:hypothetical protein
LSGVTFTLLAGMSGAIRTVFERGVAPSMLRDLAYAADDDEPAYLEAVAITKPTPLAKHREAVGLMH